MAKKPPTAARTWVGPDQLAPLLVPLAELSHDPRNARAHDARSIDAVQASLGAYGQVKPIVADAQGRIIAGNGTFTAAQALGWSHLAVVRFTGTPAQATAYGIADNRTAELSTWDEGVLAELLVELADEGTPAELPVGFTDDEVASFLPGDTAHNRAWVAPVLEVSPTTDDAAPIEEADALREKWGTAPGQLWEIAGAGGVHRLLCGDSSDDAAIARLFGGAPKAKLLSTDPPYGVNFSSQKYLPKTKAKAQAWAPIAGDDRKGADLQAWTADVWRAWLPFVERDSSFYVWSPPLIEDHALYRSMLDAGVHIQSQIVWVKNYLVLGQADYQWKHEVCWYGFFKSEKHRWLGGRAQTTTWDVSRVKSADYMHPMQKPLELYAIPMRNHTAEGDVVAEPFSGSGSQLVAAEQIKRVCFAMELEPKYVAVALERLARIGLVPKLCEKPEDLD